MGEQNHNDSNRIAARRMLAAAVGFTAVIALLAFALGGGTAARSAVAGGLIFVLPNALFVGFFFRRGGADSAAAAVRGLYLGETLKLFATVGLFAAVFLAVKPLEAGVLLGTYFFLLLFNLAGNAYLMR